MWNDVNIVVNVVNMGYPFMENSMKIIFVLNPSLTTICKE